ncbi:MAG: Lrp/AsnC family transcriptional regulator [Hydrococcus sp. C42_A2020_068]|nr:Lrp/AsnC family transcriptional regulator [Hydrococcus sp. C42_A2020_068]
MRRTSSNESNWRDKLLKNNTKVKPAPKNAEQLQQLDEIDRQILHLLQNNSRIPSAELARRVNLSAPGLQKRLKKLEESGIIEGYVTLVNREAIGLDLLCFAQITLAHHQPEYVGQFCDRVKELPEVLECHHLTGEFDYLLKVVVSNRQHLERFLFDKITRIPGVDKIRTSIVLNEIKASTSLPLSEAAIDSVSLSENE